MVGRSFGVSVVLTLVLAACGSPQVTQRTDAGTSPTMASPAGSGMTSSPTATGNSGPAATPSVIPVRRTSPSPKPTPSPNTSATQKAPTGFWDQIVTTSRILSAHARLEFKGVPIDATCWAYAYLVDGPTNSPPVLTAPSQESKTGVVTWSTDDPPATRIKVDITWGSPPKAVWLQWRYYCRPYSTRPINYMPFLKTSEKFLFGPPS